ncbi:MAG: c-type cytochrome [Steroidobacteraceae bacterium]
MNTDRPPVPAEQEALDKPWRIWASVAVGAFVLLSVILGFWVLPESEDAKFDPFAAICRSIGIPGFGGAVAPPAATPASAPQASSVAWTVGNRQLLANANVERGAKIAATVCFACHGNDGVGVAPTYPNLTHQSSAAIFKQLNDYKSGVRTGGMAAVMTPMVASLDTQQMADVAAYYASLEPRTTRYGEDVSPAIYRLIKIGSPARALPPCDSCHGVNMSGPEESPVLLGQSAPYFEQQLNAFATGERRNDNYGRMRIFAKALTPEEIQRLAKYYAPRPAG